MFKEYFRLGRPINALAGCIAVILSGYVAGPDSWWPVIMATITVLLITISTNAWNDYLDIEIDRINKPDRPLPAGTISPHGALLFSAIGSVLSLITAIFINPPAFLIAVIANILLYIYSWKLKCSVLWGNVTVATIVGLCFIFGGVAAGKIQPVIMLSITVFFAMIGREILKTMADYDGDRQQNCRTIAVARGKDTARIFMIVFLGLAAASMLLTYLIDNFHYIYILLIFLIMYPLFVYIALNSKGDLPGRVLERNSTLMKYSFFIWFLAVALGAGLR